LGWGCEISVRALNFYELSVNFSLNYGGCSRSTTLEDHGAVERANRTHTEEFYQVTPCSLKMKKLNRELRHWENIYNTLRPHQSLGYLAPHQFLLQISSQRKE